MQALRFLILTSFAFICLLQECRCQQIVKDGEGNYFERVPAFWGGYNLKPIDSTSCEFYHLKWQDALKQFNDTITCDRKDKLFINIDSYIYGTFISRNIFSRASVYHGNLNIQISAEYYFIKYLAAGIGLSNMRFKNNGYTPVYGLQPDTDKIVYRCTTIPIYIKYRKQFQGNSSFHASLAVLPTYVNYLKIRYMLPDYDEGYYYFRSYDVHQMICMYEANAGFSFNLDRRGFILFNIDYALTLDEVPFYYHYNITQKASVPQRFSATGVKLGLSFDMGDYFNYLFHLTPRAKKFKSDFMQQNPRPQGCRSI